MNPTRRRSRSLLACLVPLALLLSGCGGGGGGGDPAPHPRFTVGGSISGLAGSGLVLANGVDTLAVKANATTFTLPAAVAVGSAYTVTVKAQTDDQTCSITNGSGTMGDTDIFNVSVTCVAASFSDVSTLAGSGEPGRGDGSGVAATFRTPDGVTTDASDHLYVADFGNNTIRKIAPDGTVSTFAGSGAMGTQDGTGTAASFYAPTGIAFDAGGKLFVADRFNHQIRKITADGVVTTLVAKKDSPFNEPFGVAIDAGGNVYVADNGSNKIRRIARD